MKPPAPTPAPATGPTAPGGTRRRKPAPVAEPDATEGGRILDAAFAAVLCCRDKPFGLRDAGEVAAVDQAFRLASDLPDMAALARELLLAYAEATLAERGLPCPRFARRLPLPLPRAWRQKD